MEEFDQVSIKNKTNSGTSTEATYAFHPESSSDIRFSAVKNNPCVGLTFSGMISLFWRKRKSIDWHIYPHRIIGLLCISIFNSILACIENVYMSTVLYFSGVIAIAAADSQAPVFILGHPRTGTTLLHSLMALDEERFCFCNTFQAGFPTCFLWFETLGKKLFAGVLSETRPMDNMRLHFDLPQEDELATCVLTGFQYSPYLSLYFPREEREFRQYQSFRNAPKTDVCKWTAAFQKLMLKLKARDILQSRTKKGLKMCRRLLMKSPCHTARPRLLLKLFPDAKFVYIHRNPYEVFLSGAHMASTTYGYCFLQRPTDKDLQEYILRQGEILIGEYISCVDDGILGKHNSVEVSFEELTMNPYETMKKIYSALGLDSFDENSSSTYPNILENECVNLKGYKKNVFGENILKDELIAEIKERWALHFSRYGYCP